LAYESAWCQKTPNINPAEILGEFTDTVYSTHSDSKSGEYKLVRQTLYKRAEKMPVFQICEGDPDPEECSKKKLIDLLFNIIKYPPEAKKQRIQGVVYSKYIIKTDGSLANIRIERGIGGGCDEEVLRFIDSLPKYNPASQDGKPVPVQITLPVKFKLMK
jgi:TonB family protein